MNILTVVSDLGKGGTQRTAQNFAEGYLDLGHDSRLIAFYNLGPRYGELINRLPVWFRINITTILEINKWSPDIIHIHTNGLKNI